MSRTLAILCAVVVVVVAALFSAPSIISAIRSPVTVTPVTVTPRG